jgi:hypothetical protein
VSSCSKCYASARVLCGNASPDAGVVAAISSGPSASPKIPTTVDPRTSRRRGRNENSEGPQEAVLEEAVLEEAVGLGQEG